MVVAADGTCLLAVPFPTRTRARDRYAATYGRHSTVLNPPDRDRTSTARADYTATARTAQSAGSAKLPVPYAPNADRNRLPVAHARPARSSLTLAAAGVAAAPTHPYRTVAGVTQAQAAAPLRARTGWTNAGTTAALTRRLKAAHLG
jgi:hypothetical protein